MSDPSKAVFLSYTSQDAEAARRICEALRGVGVEVWFDQNELVGGDAWDAKIRKQIKECALFVPIISAATQARTEGYFRLEWRLADQRTHLMAKGRPFLLPVVIDATRDAEAHVPDSFTEVQWTRLRQAYGGQARDDASVAAFCARVQKLLGGPMVSGASSLDPETKSEASGRKVSPVGQRRRPWLIPAIILGAAVVALALWRPWRTKEKVATEAQQLVAKARKILDEGDEMNRETYVLAEEMLKKAEALDVTEGSAWAVHAELSFFLTRYALDRSPARFEALRMQTDRAAKLASDSAIAQVAVARALVRSAAVLSVESAGVADAQALAANYPDNPLALRLASFELLNAGKTDEAIAATRRALLLRPDDPRIKTDLVNAFIQGDRWAEGTDALAKALPGRTCARLLAYDVYLKINWSGDLSGANTAVRAWPEWFLREDRGVGHAALAALWDRNAARALELLAPVRRDYLHDFFFNGPRAVLSAWANEQLGKTEAARADWRIALQAAERELAAEPDEPSALLWKAWAQARLGDTTEAVRLLRQLEERNPRLLGLTQIVGGLAGLALAAGQTEDALVLLERFQPNPARNIRAITRTILRLNPVFDPLRNHPRFQALVSAAPGPEEKKEKTSSGTDPKNSAPL